MAALCLPCKLDHDLADSHMDPRDLGVGEEPKIEMERRSWSYYPHDPERWRGRCSRSELAAPGSDSFFETGNGVDEGT